MTPKIPGWKGPESPSAGAVPNHAVRSRVNSGMAGATTLDRVLSGLAHGGELFERLPGDRVRCDARGRRSLIPPAIGKARWHEDGRPRANRA